MHVKQKHRLNSFANGSFVISYIRKMIKPLSYINISLALIYHVMYLMNSYSLTILGILVVIVYSGLSLRSIEKDKPFTPMHYSLGMVSLIFAAFLITWTVNIVLSSIEYNYFGNSWLYISIATVFALCIILQYALVVNWGLKKR